MTPEKRKKCRQLNRDLRNARLSLKSSLDKLNKLDREARVLNNEIRSLEGERRALMASVTVDATGLGRRKGLPSAMIGVGKDAADLLFINNEIRKKISALSMKIDLQNRQQGFVKDKERALDRVENRISQLGCR